ncbi:MAG: DUF58 domain-containing protein [Actinomycetota bacterium]|jgi:uncharacterized protein (DUF58 family)
MLTRAGWGALAAAGTAAVLGRVFGILELYVLAGGIVVAVVWAVLTVLRPMPRLAVHRRVAPSSVMVGEDARVDLVIANSGNHRTPVMRLWEPVGGAGAVMHLAPLNAGERTAAAYRLPTARRGLVTAGPLRVRRADVLGIAARSTVVPGSAELLVTPHHSPVSMGHHASAGVLGDLVRMKALGQTGNEFHALRPYVPGDDIRRISWKASARSTDLIVKDTAPEGLRRCTVVLDLDASGYTGDAGDAAFERAVSAAASVLTGAAQAGLLTRMVATDVDLRGHDVTPVALRWLATVEPREHTTAVPALQTTEGLGLLVVVAPALDSPFVTEVRGNASPDDVVVVIATRHHSTSTVADRRLVVDATDDAAFTASWNALVGDGGIASRLPAAYRTEP